MSIRTIGPASPGVLFGEGNAVPFRDAMHHKYPIKIPIQHTAFCSASDREGAGLGFISQRLIAFKIWTCKLGILRISTNFDLLPLIAG